jgi:hypothetical protein
MLSYYYIAYHHAICLSSFSIDKSEDFKYLFFMPKIAYNTRLDEDLIKQFKILAILQSKRQNELLEEAIKDLLKKYEKKGDK